MGANNHSIAKRAKITLQMLFILVLPILITAQSVVPVPTTTTTTTTAATTTAVAPSPTTAPPEQDTDYELYRDARAVSLTWERMVGGYLLMAVGLQLSLRGFRHYRLSMFLAGFLGGGLIHKKGGRIALLVGTTVFGMLVGLFVGRRLIIPCSSIVGAYVTIIGLDFFARTGILIAIARFLKTDPMAYYRVTANAYVMLGVLGGFAVFSMVIQVLGWKKHRRSLVAKVHTIHEFDNDWTVIGIKGQAVRPDPTYPNGGYGTTSTSRNNATVYNEKKPWNPSKRDGTHSRRTLPAMWVLLQPSMTL
ncbi:hypothetical protein BGX26_000265 [Mortierella sp. AD094]|nr:hypothetical protein BGX26_000265 [Mortierella sp. AD094]